MQSIDKNIINSISIAERYDGVKRVGIFGSYARGEQTQDSDIDILFDYYYKNEHDNGIDNMLEYLDDLEEDMKKYVGDKKIDFVSYRGVIKSDNEYLRENILNDVVWIYDTGKIIYQA